VGLDLPAGTAVGSAWNAEATTSGTTATFRNAAWNGTLAPAGTTTFGLTLTGSATSLGTPTCRAS
jgi:cellulase/cellobiase CelA1